MKTLLITDLHFDDKIKGLIQAQSRCIYDIVKKEDPDEIIIMGDLMMRRRPSPTVLLALHSLIDTIAKWGRVIIIRGNHDSETKSDDGVTALSLFHRPPHIRVVTQTTYQNGASYFKPTVPMDAERIFIPHYENETKILEVLENANEGCQIFGHFGYKGSLNSAGDADFSIPLSAFRNNSFLGHIHRFNSVSQSVEGREDVKVTLLGTPYTTKFGESDKPCYYATIEEGKVTFVEIDHGPRHLVVDYENLEEYKDVIKDPKYWTLLRVYVNKLSPDNSTKTARHILEEYEPQVLDIKFHPIIDDNNPSTYSPQRELFSVNDAIIEDYVDNSQTMLSKEDILGGLRLLKDED